MWKTVRKMIANPFIITGEYISKDYFCDRDFETGVITSNILNGRNTVLISPRRMGKTGLISHVLDQDEIKNNYRSFTIDLYSTSSLAEMVMMLSKEIIQKNKSKGEKTLTSFIQVVKSLRPGAKIDPVSGELKFDLSLGEITQPSNSIEEIFDYLEQQEQPCIVAIDEFQQIADYPEKNALALLRTHIQKIKNTWFIFSGSNRRMMEKLFNSPSEPFYQSCCPLYLGVIDKDEYYNFSSKHFANDGRTIPKECFDLIYNTFEGHTWYVQRILNELYAQIKSSPITTDDVVYVLDYVTRLSSRGFEEQFHSLSYNQKQLLIAIAKEGKASGITSMSFIKRHSLKSPSTVQSAAKALYDNEVITKEDDAYLIYNRLFALWIRKKYTTEQ